MGIGRLQINMAAQLEARVAGRRAPERVLGPAVLELGRELVRVEAEPGQDPVAEELALVQAEVALELSPVAEEREHVQAEVALELSPVAEELVLVQVAVALRTKSATAAHPHDLVPAPRVEDSAAAVETTRDPAATEAGVAWAAAVTAVAVAPE
jgi:hypothetical protein